MVQAPPNRWQDVDADRPLARSCDRSCWPRLRPRRLPVPIGGDRLRLAGGGPSREHGVDGPRAQARDRLLPGARSVSARPPSAHRRRVAPSPATPAPRTTPHAARRAARRASIERAGPAAARACRRRAAARRARPRGPQVDREEQMLLDEATGRGCCWARSSPTSTSARRAVRIAAAPRPAEDAPPGARRPRGLDARAASYWTIEHRGPAARRGTPPAARLRLRRLPTACPPGAGPPAAPTRHGGAADLARRPRSWERGRSVVPGISPARRSSGPGARPAAQRPPPGGLIARRRRLVGRRGQQDRA